MFQIRKNFNCNMDGIIPIKLEFVFSKSQSIVHLDSASCRQIPKGRSRHPKGGAQQGPWNKHAEKLPKLAVPFPLEAYHLFLP